MPIDPNKIFNLFEGGGLSDSSKPNKKSPPLPSVDTKSPFYILGMFKKLIINYNVYSEKLLKALSGSGDLDVKIIRESSKIMVYEQAYAYLLDFNFKSKKFTDYIKKEQDLGLKSSLEDALKFFEDREEYEKCLVIKNILDLY